MTDAPRLRIVFFGSSIVSDWRNPLATSARPILAALVGMGHDVLFLEERRNQWLMGMLKTRGLGPERAFSAAYPAIHHRTYDLPRPGNARRVWFAQQVGTADAIIGLPGTPQAVIDEISAFNSKLVVRGLHSAASEADADFRIGLAGQNSVAAEFAPAVALHRQSGIGERSGVAVVAYDRDLGEQASSALSDLHPVLIDQADKKLDGWLSVPEVSLGDLYNRCGSVVVVGSWSDELTWTRALLPMTHGCQVAAAGPKATTFAATGAKAVDVSQLSTAIREFHHDLSKPAVSEDFSASRQAQTLIDAILRAIAEKRATPS